MGRGGKETERGSGVKPRTNDFYHIFICRGSCTKPGMVVEEVCFFLAPPVPSLAWWLRRSASFLHL